MVGGRVVVGYLGAGRARTRQTGLGVGQLDMNDRQRHCGATAGTGGGGRRESARAQRHGRGARRRDAAGDAAAWRKDRRQRGAQQSGGIRTKAEGERCYTAGGQEAARCTAMRTEGNRSRNQHVDSTNTIIACRITKGDCSPAVYMSALPRNKPPERPPSEAPQPPKCPSLPTRCKASPEC